MLQFTIYNYQFTNNKHQCITGNEYLYAKHMPSLRIEKCALKIATGWKEVA